MLMRVLRMVLLTALVSASLLVTGGAGPALACSCADLRMSAHVGGADEIFTGTLVAIADPPRRLVMTGSDPITYTVAVDGVYRGDVGDTVEFQSAMSGASCGLGRMVVGRRYLVFASTDGSHRSAGLCSGTAPATHRRVKAVERLTAAPRQPIASRHDASELDASELVASAGGDGDRPRMGVSSWVIGVAGVVGAAALGARVRISRSRRAPEQP